MQIHKQYEGCYRTAPVDGKFGQIKRTAAMVGRRSSRGVEWRAEIRDTVTGELVRYAGIWPTRRAAVLEVSSILNRSSDTSK